MQYLCILSVELYKKNILKILLYKKNEIMLDGDVTIYIIHKIE